MIAITIAERPDDTYTTSFVNATTRRAQRLGIAGKGDRRDSTWQVGASLKSARGIPALCLVVAQNRLVSNNSCTHEHRTTGTI